MDGRVWVDGGWWRAKRELPAGGGVGACRRIRSPPVGCCFFLVPCSPPISAGCWVLQRVCSCLQLLAVGCWLLVAVGELAGGSGKQCGCRQARTLPLLPNLQLGRQSSCCASGGKGKLPHQQGTRRGKSGTLCPPPTAATSAGERAEFSRPRVIAPGSNESLLQSLSRPAISGLPHPTSQSLTSS